MSFKVLTSLLLVVVAATSAYGAIVSWEEFVGGITSSGYPTPRRDQYDAFINRMPAGGIKDKTEAAIFLSQILWESGGLRYKRELACVNTGCPGVYDHSVGAPGKNYYGRGYIQLTHSYNYKAASLALYHDLRLINDPEIVANTEDAAWGTSFWFWAANVHNKPGLQQHQFGVATRAVNGMECTGNMPAAHKRFDIYKKVHAAFHLNTPVNEHGCYN